MPTIWHLIVWHVLHCMKFRQKNPPELSSLSKNFQFAPYCPLSFQHHVPSCGHFCVFYRCFSQLCWKSLLTRVCGTWTGLASETCQFWCRWCRIATWGHSIDARVNSHQKPAHFFFLFFLLLGENHLSNLELWQKFKRKLAKSPTPNPCFFLSFGFACPRMNHSTYETHVRMSFATLQQKTEESYAHARKLRSRSRLQIERTDLISDYRSKGTKTFRRDATCIENASWRGSLPFFHVISGILNECWENFHKVLSRKAWKDCKTLFILAFLRFFPLHGGAIISLDELAFRWISWDQTLGEHEESFRPHRGSSIELEKTPKVSWSV